MDGDIAPLPELVDLCGRHNATVMVDEAHATGCLGPGGRGIVAYFGLEKSVLVSMSTLSKTLGSFGAFVAGDALLREYLVNVSRSFIFTTALPPTVTAASLAALNILEQQPNLVHQVQENGKYLRNGLQAMGFDTLASETHIVPVRVGNTVKTLEFARRYESKGSMLLHTSSDSAAAKLQDTSQCNGHSFQGGPGLRPLGLWKGRTLFGIGSMMII